MSWVAISSEQLAKRLGIDYDEQELKHQLIEKLIAIRVKQGLSQAELAKRLKVSQSRIAKIESRIGAAKVSFDTILKTFAALGYICEIKPKKASGSKVAA
jgi:DNA-binding XRE family transcriptional regulator